MLARRKLAVIDILIMCGALGPGLRLDYKAVIQEIYYSFTSWIQSGIFFLLYHITSGIR